MRPMPAGSRREADALASVSIWPATPDRWKDLAALFGPRGACAGCWCMWWRLSQAEFEHRKGAGNRRGLHRLVLAGKSPGLLAYVDGQAVGWCCVGLRETFPRLERSRVLARVDARNVWSIVCFYIARGYRRQGLSIALTRAAVDFARLGGAEIVEAYPIDSRTQAYPDPYAYTGLVGTFREAGFREVVRRSPKRPIMRRFLANK